VHEKSLIDFSLHHLITTDEDVFIWASDTTLGLTNLLIYGRLNLTKRNYWPKFR